MAPHRTSDRRPTNSVRSYGSIRGVIFSNTFTAVYLFDAAVSCASYLTASVCVFRDSTGREVNDVAEAKTQSMTTTTVGTVVSYDRKSVSKGQQSVRKSGKV